MLGKAPPRRTPTPCAAAAAVDRDRIDGADRSTRADDRHDAGLADQTAIARPAEHRRQQTGAETLDLSAGIAQSSHLQHRLRADAQHGGARQAEQIKPSRENILAQIARADSETPHLQFVEQFGMDQVNLPQIRLRRIHRDARTMLHRRPAMRIAAHPVSGDQVDAGSERLGETMRLVLRHGNDLPFRHQRLPAC